MKLRKLVRFIGGIVVGSALFASATYFRMSDPISDSLLDRGFIEYGLPENCFYNDIDLNPTICIGVKSDVSSLNHLVEANDCKCGRFYRGLPRLFLPHGIYPTDRDYVMLTNR